MSTCGGGTMEIFPGCGPFAGQIKRVFIMEAMELEHAFFNSTHMAATSMAQLADGDIVGKCSTIQRFTMREIEEDFKKRIYFSQDNAIVKLFDGWRHYGKSAKMIKRLLKISRERK